MGEAELLQLELVNKRIHKPHCIVGCHLPLERAEHHLVPICAGNILHGVIYCIASSILRVVHPCVYLVAAWVFLRTLVSCYFKTDPSKYVETNFSIHFIWTWLFDCDIF